MNPQTIQAAPLFPKKLLLGIQEGRCNLRCPKCYVHGRNTPSDNPRPAGRLDRALFTRILDECAPFRPRIAPQTWDEPLMNSEIVEYLREIKLRRLPVTMDTNGFLLAEERMKEFVELEIDSIFISLDAHSAETLKKTRGTDQLLILQRKVLSFLEIRGARPLPRIGVSFVIEQENRHELDSFLEYWTRHVDVVRVNELFLRDRAIPNAPPSRRTPCWSLWDSLMIHCNGEAALCCADTHYENRIGNLRDSSISALWNGPYFARARLAHERGDFGAIPICAECMLWSNEAPVESRTPELLIKKTATHAYYNRLDRLDTVIPGNRYIESDRK